MNTSIEGLLWRRAGGSIKRYHTHPTLTQQRVDSHSFNVVMIILHFMPDAPMRLIKAALYHDLAELETGDTPANVKWRSPELTSELDRMEKVVNVERGIHIDDLTDDEVNWLKFADTLAYCLFSLEERKLGNQNMDIVFERGIARLTHYAIPQTNTEVCELIRQLSDLYAGVKFPILRGTVLA